MAQFGQSEQLIGAPIIKRTTPSGEADPPPEPTTLITKKDHHIIANDTCVFQVRRPTDEERKRLKPGEPVPVELFLNRRDNPQSDWERHNFVHNVSGTILDGILETIRQGEERIRAIQNRSELRESGQYYGYQQGLTDFTSYLTALIVANRIIRGSSVPQLEYQQFQFIDSQLEAANNSLMGQLIENLDIGSFQYFLQVNQPLDGLSSYMNLDYISLLEPRR